MSELRIGQFWRDMVNGDVLKITGFNWTDWQETQQIGYVVCSCYPRGEYYMGIQEMKASHFDTERFKPVGWWKSLWYRVKLRKAQPLA